MTSKVGYLLFLSTLSASAHAFYLTIPNLHAGRCASTKINLFTRWGGGTSSSEGKEDGSRVDQVMDSMQSFKANQKLGSLTSEILQELSGSSIEGISDDGKVRVMMNGQQYPVGCQLGEDSNILQEQASLTQAMQDAHAKSLDLMKSKMSALYEDLGLQMATTQTHSTADPNTSNLSSNSPLFASWGGSSGNANNNAEDGRSDEIDSTLQSSQKSLTTGLVQDLASVNVEGRSDDGKIRVVMNGQQYPLGCQVMDDVDMSIINSAITQAMQDAHAKSRATMDSKMKYLYDDLGLPAAAPKK